MANLLKNPGFEGDFRNWNGNPEISVAQDWLPFWVAQQPTDEDWKNRQPVYRAALRQEDPRRVRAGQAAQMYYTSWATHIAGIMQTVSVVPGQQLRLTAFGHAWSTDSDAPDQSIQPGQVRLKVGIDPVGGANPLAPGVVWSQERAVYDGYDAGFSVDAVAGSSQITAFLLSAPEWPKKHNDVYWDDVQLESFDIVALPQPGVPDVLLTLDSPTQLPHMPVTVIATSTYNLTNVQVIVSGPSGSLHAEYKGVQPQATRYTWRWEFIPPLEGPYTVTLSADGIQAVSSSLRIGTGMLPGPTTAVALTPSAGAPLIPVAATGRGQPRTQYHRTYVLLPPTAGKEWVHAIAESEIWQNERWTIGYSADDAGIGDLAKRTVVVVNPSAWPDPIIPWLEMWYPGVAVHPITAVSPDDLRTILDTLRSQEVKPELG